jgi:hypothetical protein
MENGLLKHGGTGHQHISDKTISSWKDVYEITKFKRVMEIGFNVGHSSYLILDSFEDVYVHSFDICKFDRQLTIETSNKFKNYFKERFDFTECDSKKLSIDDLKKYEFDFVFIDGDHSYDGVKNDYEIAKSLGVEYCLIDDYNEDFPGILKFIEDVDANIVKVYNIDSMNKLGEKVKNKAILVKINS